MADKLEALLASQRERNSILQCQEIAKELGYNSMTFDLCGPKGKKSCKWLDAYYGMFTIEGEEGFYMATELAFASDLWCENIKVEEA
jgi:hypothetical protein